MGLPSKFSHARLNINFNKKSCRLPCNKSKSDGCIFKPPSQNFEIEYIQPLSIQEIRKNLNSSDLAKNIANLAYVRKLCECKKPFVGSFLSDNAFIVDVINEAYIKNQDDLHIATLKLIAEVVKEENYPQNVNISIPYIVLSLEASLTQKSKEAILALRNMAFSTDSSTVIFTMFGGTASLLKYFGDQIELDMLTDITHILLNVFRTRPILTNVETENLMEIFQKLLFHPNEEVIGNIFGILDHITNSFDGPFNEILQTNIMASVVEHLTDWNLRVSMKALNVVTNFLNNAIYNQALAVLQFDILNAIPNLLELKVLRLKSLHLVAEYLQGNPDDIQSVLDLGITESMLTFLKNEDDEVCKQSIACFRIIAEGASWLQKKHVLNLGLIRELCSILCTSTSSSVLKAATMTIRIFFDASKVEPRIMREILKQAEKLQNSIDSLKNLPNIFDLRFEALQLSYSYLKAQMWLKENS